MTEKKISFFLILLLFVACSKQQYKTNTVQWNLHLFKSIDLKSSLEKYRPLLWNDSVFAFHAVQNVLTIFKLDETFEPVLWKKFIIDSPSDDPYYQDSHVGVVGDTMFFQYYRKNSDGVEIYLMFINEKGEMVRLLNFSKTIQLLSSDKDEMIFLNSDGSELSFPYQTNIFYILDKTSHLIPAKAMASIYFNIKIRDSIFSFNNQLFFISPFSPTTSVDPPRHEIDRSVMHLYQMDKKTFVVEEIENFSKQYQNFFLEVAKKETKKEKTIIKTQGDILHTYYDGVENKMYFSLGTHVFFKNKISRRLSEIQMYLGVYNMNSGELSLGIYNSPNNSIPYFLGKMDNRIVLYQYDADVPNNKFTLKFFEVKSD